MLKFILLSLCFGQVALAADCTTYLRRLENGATVGVKRIESLGGKSVEVIDVSGYVAERRAKSDPTLNIFNLSDVFAESRIFLGFGKPNVYLGIPGASSYQKFAAKSLKRGDSQLVDTKDRAQSGLLVVFKNLPTEAIAQITQSATAHEGTRQWTCVNANCRVLKDSGFTIGGESLDQYYFPMALLGDLLRYGIEYGGKPVEYDLIRTTPDYLENVGLSIKKSVATTMCRHIERACTPKEDALNAAAVGKQNIWVVKFKNAKRKLGLFATSQLTQWASQGEVGGPEVVRVPEEAAPVRLALPESELRPFTLSVSEPSKFGAILRLLWGPHSLFEVPMEVSDVTAALPDVLDAFPDQSPSFMTRVKRDFLFSKPVVKLIRSQLASQATRFEGVTQNDLFDMLRADSEGFPNRYNLVLMGDRVLVMKIGIQMKTVDWILSKHVLISGYSPDVRFAGEIWKDANGVIWVNRNSGTYKPSDKMLQAIVPLLQKKFPGVRIEMAPDV